MDVREYCVNACEAGAGSTCDHACRVCEPGLDSRPWTDERDGHSAVDLVAAARGCLKVTTIYVTHDQTEAMTLGDRVAVAYQGDLQQVGTPRELYRRPANRFVAGFIGSPAMNLIRASLVQGPDGSRHEAVFGPHRLALPEGTFHENPQH